MARLILETETVDGSPLRHEIVVDFIGNGDLPVENSTSFMKNLLYLYYHAGFLNEVEVYVNGSEETDYLKMTPMDSGELIEMDTFTDVEIVDSDVVIGDDDVYAESKIPEYASGTFGDVNELMTGSPDAFVVNASEDSGIVTIDVKTDSANTLDLGNSGFEDTMYGSTLHSSEYSPELDPNLRNSR